MAEQFRTRNDAAKYLEVLWRKNEDDEKLWQEGRAIRMMMDGEGIETARQYWQANQAWLVRENGANFRAGLSGKYPKKSGRKKGKTVSGNKSPNQVSLAAQVAGRISKGTEVGEALEETADRYGLTLDAVRKAYERNRKHIVFGM